MVECPLILSSALLIYINAWTIVLQTCCANGPFIYFSDCGPLQKYHFCFCLLTETSSCSLRQYLHAFKGLGSAATLQDAGADSVDRNYETFKWSDGRFIANCPHHFGPLSMSLETQETGLCCLFLIYLLLIQMCTQPWVIASDFNMLDVSSWKHAYLCFSVD